MSLMVFFFFEEFQLNDVYETLDGRAFLLFSFGLPVSFLGGLLFFYSGSKHYFTREQKDDQFKKHQGRHNTLVSFRFGYAPCRLYQQHRSKSDKNVKFYFAIAW